MAMKLKSTIICNNKNLRAEYDNIIFDKSFSRSSMLKTVFNCICAVEISKKLAILYAAVGNEICEIVMDPKTKSFVCESQTTDQPIKDLRSMVKIQVSTGNQLLTVHEKQLIIWDVLRDKRKLYCLKQIKLYYSIACFTVFLEKFLFVGYCNINESKVKILNGQLEVLPGFEIKLPNSIKFIEIFKPDIQQLNSQNGKEGYIRLISGDNKGNLYVHKFYFFLEADKTIFKDIKLIKAIETDNQLIYWGFSSFNIRNHFFVIRESIIECVNIEELKMKKECQTESKELIQDILTLDTGRQTCCLVFYKSSFTIYNIILNSFDAPEFHITDIIKDISFTSDLFRPKLQMMHTIRNKKLYILIAVLHSSDKLRWYRMKFKKIWQMPKQCDENIKKKASDNFDLKRNDILENKKTAEENQKDNNLLLSKLLASKSRNLQIACSLKNHQEIPFALKSNYELKNGNLAPQENYLILMFKAKL